MRLDDVTTEHLVGADAAVVEGLRRGEPVGREAERATVLEERVLLLDAEDRRLVGVLLGDRAELRPRVGDVRRHVGEQHLAHDEDVVAAADRVGVRRDRLEHAVGVAARRLVGARTVEAPDRQVLAVLEDLGLRPETGTRLGAVDPDVLGLVAHARLLIVVCSGAPAAPGALRLSGEVASLFGRRFPRHCPNMNALFLAGAGLGDGTATSVDCSHAAAARLRPADGRRARCPVRPPLVHRRPRAP